MTQPADDWVFPEVKARWVCQECGNIVQKAVPKVLPKSPSVCPKCKSRGLMPQGV